MPGKRAPINIDPAPDRAARFQMNDAAYAAVLVCLVVIQDSEYGGRAKKPVHLPSRQVAHVPRRAETRVSLKGVQASRNGRLSYKIRVFSEIPRKPVLPSRAH